jgi:FAD/FMN-containing dehydrogenase
MEKLPHLLTHLTLHSILHSTPQSPSYPALRAQYIVDTPSTPLLITRPKNAEQVSCIVKYCVEQGIEFSVRSGGHDLYGRCFVDGAVGVDLRDLSYVVVEGNGGDGAEGAAASIGGGILAGTLATELAKSGMVTASGSMPRVGYVGWASHGGKFFSPSLKFPFCLFHFWTLDSLSWDDWRVKDIWN